MNTLGDWTTGRYLVFTASSRDPCVSEALHLARVAQISWTKKAATDAQRIKLAMDGLVEWPGVKQAKALANWDDYRLP